MVRIMKNVMTGDKTPVSQTDENNSGSSSDASSSNIKDERSITGESEHSHNLSDVEGGCDKCSSKNRYETQS